MAKACEIKDRKILGFEYKDFEILKGMNADFIGCVISIRDNLVNLMDEETDDKEKDFYPDIPMIVEDLQQLLKKHILIAKENKEVE